MLVNVSLFLCLVTSPELVCTPEIKQEYTQIDNETIKRSKKEIIRNKKIGTI